MKLKSRNNLLGRTGFRFALIAILLLGTTFRAMAQQEFTPDPTPSPDQLDDGIPFSSLSANYPTFGAAAKVYDATIAASLTKCPSNSLWNSVTSSCGSKIGLAQGTTYFTSTLTASSTSSITPIYTFNSTTNNPNQPFIVAVAIDPTQSFNGMQSVFVINPYASYTNQSSGFDGTKLTFALLRDSQGFWYTGKAIDSAPNANGQPTDGAYLNRLWDPVSPCATKNTCTSDIVYVEFFSNGLIEIDEFATLANPPASASATVWNTATLPYGYPVVSYDPGTSTEPSSTLNFYNAAQVSIGALPASEFGANSIYLQYNTPGASTFPQAPLKRVAIWSLNNFTNSFQAYQGELLSEAENFENTSYNPNWAPCNTGQFQNGLGSYTPQSTIATPCNSASTGALGSVLPMSLAFPSRDGSGNNSQILTITNAKGASSDLYYTPASIIPIKTSLPSDTANFSVSAPATHACATGSPILPGTFCTIQVNYIGTKPGIFSNSQVSIGLGSAPGASTQISLIPLNALMVAAPLVSLNSDANTGGTFTIEITDLNPTSVLQQTPTQLPLFTVAIDGTTYAPCANVISATSCPVSGLTSATTHTYTVSESIASVTATSASQSTTTGISAPSTLSTSTITPTGFTLSWSDNNVYAGGVTPSYTFTLNGSAASCAVSGTTCSFTGLTPATTYIVGVVASVNGINSTSADTGLTTPPGLPPSAVASATTCAINSYVQTMAVTQLKYTWTAATNSGSAPIDSGILIWPSMAV